MKKIFFAALASVALCFSSCEVDDFEVSPGTPSNPEKVVAGTYSGTFTVTSNEGESQQAGSVEVVADSAYRAQVIVSLEGGDQYQGKGNVAPSSSGYTVTNATANQIGADGFNMTVSNDGKVTFYFSLSKKSGRKTLLFKYNFEGSK